MRLIGASFTGDVNSDLVSVRVHFGSPTGRANTKIILHKDKTIYAGFCHLGSWSYQDCIFLVRGAKKGSVMIDLGANVGLMSLQFLNQSQQFNTRAILVEPMPSEAYAINHNLSNRNFSLFNVALADLDGQSKFYIRDGNRGNSSTNINRMRREDYSEITVKTLSVKSFVSSLNLLEDETIILKCDLEGSDASVLSKLPQFIWDKIARGVIEVWSHKEISDNDVEQLMEFLKDYKLCYDHKFRKLISPIDLAKFWTSGIDEIMQVYIIREGLQ
jgi:FkbM family methyltransferase